MKNAEWKKQKPSNLVVSFLVIFCTLRFVPKLISLYSPKLSIGYQHLTVSLHLLSVHINGSVRSLELVHAFSVTSVQVGYYLTYTSNSM